MKRVSLSDKIGNGAGQFFKKTDNGVYVHVNENVDVNGNTKPILKDLKDVDVYVDVDVHVKKFEETHKRKTIWLEKDLLEWLSRYCKETHKKETYIFNQALKNFREGVLKNEY
ncbi:MAG: hypothetical protein PWQ59_2066 [Thermoanaerobacterium sp.]|nr:hypothetical protein [Thermoanaerobacterium sp.]MDI3530127.1 hypothetical protein [Thermoanaerobacter sp.]